MFSADQSLTIKKKGSSNIIVYIIPGISETFPFKPQVKREINAVQFWYLDHLPPKQRLPKYVFEIVAEIKKWKEENRFGESKVDHEIKHQKNKEGFSIGGDGLKVGGGMNFFESIDTHGNINIANFSINKIESDTSSRSSTADTSSKVYMPPLNADEQRAKNAEEEKNIKKEKQEKERLKEKKLLPIKKKFEEMGSFGSYVLKSSTMENQLVDGLYSSFITNPRANYEDDENEGYSSDDLSNGKILRKTKPGKEILFIENYAKMNDEEREKYEFYYLHPSLKDKVTLIHDLNLRGLAEDEVSLAKGNVEESVYKITDNRIIGSLLEDKCNEPQNFIDISKILKEMG